MTSPNPMALDAKALEAAAREICAAKGIRPDMLEPGDVYGIDGTLPNGDPAHFMWREFVNDAEAVVRAYLDALPPPEAGEGLEPVADDPALPCDVSLPPNTVFRAGVRLSSLLVGLRVRGMATPPHEPDRDGEDLR